MMKGATVFLVATLASIARAAFAPTPAPMPHVPLDAGAKLHQYRQGTPQVQLDHAAFFRGIAVFAGLCLCSVCFMCYHGSQARGTNETYVYGTPRGAGDSSSSTGSGSSSGSDSDGLLGFGGGGYLFDRSSSSSGSDGDSGLGEEGGGGGWGFAGAEETKEDGLLKETVRDALVSQPLSDTSGIELLEMGGSAAGASDVGGGGGLGGTLGLAVGGPGEAGGAVRRRT